MSYDKFDTECVGLTFIFGEIDKNISSGKRRHDKQFSLKTVDTVTYLTVRRLFGKWYQN